MNIFRSNYEPIKLIIGLSLGNGDFSLSENGITRNAALKHGWHGIIIIIVVQDQNSMSKANSGIIIVIIKWKWKSKVDTFIHLSYMLNVQCSKIWLMHNFRAIIQVVRHLKWQPDSVRAHQMHTLEPIRCHGLNFKTFFSSSFSFIG